MAVEQRVERSQCARGPRDNVWRIHKGIANEEGTAIRSGMLSRSVVDEVGGSALLTVFF